MIKEELWFPHSGFKRFVKKLKDADKTLCKDKLNSKLFGNDLWQTFTKRTHNFAVIETTKYGWKMQRNNHRC